MIRINILQSDIGLIILYVENVMIWIVAEADTF